MPLIELGLHAPDDDAGLIGGAGLGPPEAACLLDETLVPDQPGQEPVAGDDGVGFEEVAAAGEPRGVGEGRGPAPCRVCPLPVVS